MAGITDIFQVGDIATAVSSLGSPLPSKGAVGFGQLAQDQNQLPGHGNILNQDPRALEMVRDGFWDVSEEIDASRWNKRFPYQLLVLDVDDNGVYSRDHAWEFTLPIPPESLTISTPFAISTQMTLGGVVEEHNGAPIKMLSFRGNTGVMPNRDTAAASPGVPGAQAATGGIFGGTIQNFVQTAQTTVQSLGFFQANLMNETELNVGAPGFKGRGTGYYQMRLLQKFLQAYVNMKMKPEGRRKRLAVAIWRDQAVYIVTPVHFELARTAQDPLGHPYTMQFKAWRQIRLDEQPGALENYQPRRNDPTFLRTALNVISEARSVLNGARTALEAVRGDVDTLLFEPLRQTALLLKDGLGVATSLAELPVNIAQDAATVPAEFTSATSLGQASRTLNQQVQDVETMNKALNGPGAGRASNTASQALSTAYPGAKLFANSADNFALMSGINVQKLQLKPSTQKKIREEVERVRQLERFDFEQMRDQIKQMTMDFAAAIGDSGATFEESYGRPTITATKTPTDEDYEVLFALNNTLLQMNKLVLSAPQSNARVQAIEYVAGLARRSGIAFKVPVSKFAVPYPYGSTLEQVSARYLGDPNRWMEIAALNGLRTPYVDEEGFDLPLITNGRGNEVVVASSANLYEGQPVTLHATNTVPSKRRITQLDVVSDNMTIVHLDGEEDLDRFIVMANAALHAYTPDTVNSQQTIYIPSQRPVDDELTTRKIPGVSDFAPMLERGGIDLLLTQSGDAAIGPDGDWKLAVGLTNLVQRVRIALTTAKGSVPQHPNFGLGLTSGMSTADLDATQLLAATRGLFQGDNDFSGIFAARVEKRGPRASLSVSVGIAGQDIVLPVSVDVRR